jgi:hypothetical protein
MKQCNKCSKRKCDRLRMHRAHKRILTLEELQGDCPQHVPVPRVTESLVDLAVGNNAQGVQDCLSQFPFATDHLISGGKKRGRKRNRKRAYRGKRQPRNTGSTVGGSGN